MRHLAGTLSLCVLLGAGCAGTHESAVRAELDRHPRPGERPATDPDAVERAPGPGVAGYVAYAAERSPELRSSYERWRASVHRISPARRLPDPMVEFGVFLWNPGASAGMPARLGVRQEFPWPTRLTAGADAASAEARALGRRFEAQLLDLRQRVSEAYYRLWFLRKDREIEREQLEILRALSESARGRIVTGEATVADQQQIDLTVARLDDRIAALGEQEREAEARLRAVIGAPPGTSMPTPEEPPDVLQPAETEQELRQAALEHPFIESFALMSEAADAAARAERAARLPSLAVGVEWMRMPGPMRQSGVVGALGVRVPFWQWLDPGEIRAAEAEGRVQQAERETAAQRAAAELEAALSAVRDAARRVRLNEDTLLPQAEAAYASVLGAYATGRTTVAASLLAQRDLLEIRVGLEQARAEHAVAWARLEQVVGRAVEGRALRQAPSD